MERLYACTAGVDLGKTHCRVTIFEDDVPMQTLSGPGFPGAAAIGGAEAVSTTVLAILLPLLASLETMPTAIGVGAAGVLTAPDAAITVARGLVERTQMSAAVTSDVIAAHAGAFAGAPGTVLVAGTGAVAVTLCETGVLTQVDGWGPSLGDLGSGAWLGRNGIRAVLDHAQRCGPFTALTNDLKALIGTESHPVHWVNNSDSPARRSAQFAPAVLNRAQEQDEVASTIVARAIEHLVTTATAAVHPTGLTQISCVGGLTAHPWFHAQLTTALRGAGLHPVEPLGDASEGARQIATSVDLPHERFIHRA